MATKNDRVRLVSMLVAFCLTAVSIMLIIFMTVASPAHSKLAKPLGTEQTATTLGAVHTFAVAPDAIEFAAHTGDRLASVQPVSTTESIRQIVVLSGTKPISRAIVYRGLISQTVQTATLLRNAERQILSSNQAGQIENIGLARGDELFALVPISSTAKYTMYYTSGVITNSNPVLYQVDDRPVQTLTVASQQPLILFNLDVSLEFNANSYSGYRERLELLLQRTSEILYDWTNGRTALGKITIYHERAHWQDADIRIYASNRMRPNAYLGGLFTKLANQPTNLTATQSTTNAAVRMGVSWNRFGASSGNLEDDWARALAHELGHYLFELSDNYLGIEDDHLVPVANCPGAMADPYLEDEFASEASWEDNCRTTLAHQSINCKDGERHECWDWAKIRRRFPLLTSVVADFDDNAGPTNLPFAFTDVVIVAPTNLSETLNVPIITIRQSAGPDKKMSKIHITGRDARAFLFQDDRLIDLGRPVLDRVIAWGARPNDRLCVYELAAGLVGCEKIKKNYDRVILHSTADWNPAILVTPLSESTLSVTVTNILTPAKLYARLFPVTEAGATGLVPLTAISSGYTGVLTATGAAKEGLVHIIQVPITRDEVPTPDTLGNCFGTCFEAIAEYSVGDSPAFIWVAGGGTAIAPLISADGQVILYNRKGNPATNQAADKMVYTLQSLPVTPDLPGYAALVGQVYRFAKSPAQLADEVSAAAAPTIDLDLADISISFQYLPGSIVGLEQSVLRIYFHDGNPHGAWVPLPTRSDPIHSIASATLVGEGLYALMASTDIQFAIAGWHMFGYTAPTRQPIQVSEALQTIKGKYTTIYGFASGEQGLQWLVYDRDAPAWVNTLPVLQHGHGYLIQITEPVTLSLPSDMSFAQDAVAGNQRAAERGIGERAADAENFTQPRFILTDDGNLTPDSENWLANVDRDTVLGLARTQSELFNRYPAVRTAISNNVVLSTRDKELVRLITTPAAEIPDEQLAKYLRSPALTEDDLAIIQDENPALLTTKIGVREILQNKSWYMESTFNQLFPNFDQSTFAPNLREAAENPTVNFELLQQVALKQPELITPDIYATVRENPGLGWAAQIWWSNVATQTISPTKIPYLATEGYVMPWQEDLLLEKLGPFETQFYNFYRDNPNWAINRSIAGPIDALPPPEAAAMITESLPIESPIEQVRNLLGPPAIYYGVITTTAPITTETLTVLANGNNCADSRLGMPATMNEKTVYTYTMQVPMLGPVVDQTIVICGAPDQPITVHAGAYLLKPVSTSPLVWNNDRPRKVDFNVEP